MTTRFADHLLDGDHASRPAATGVPTGTLYACSDHDLIYQSDGATWSTWSDVTGSGGASMTYSAYTATLTGATTNPTLGTGGSASGRYTQNGKFVTGNILVTCGTSGFNAGSGAFLLALPVPANTTHGFAMLGAAYWSTGGGSTVVMGYATRYAPSSGTKLQLLKGDAVALNSTSGVTNNDVIIVQFTYEAA